MLLNRKFVLLIAIICVFLSVITVQDTYAKYTSTLNETTRISVARWRILVNNFDIRSSSTTTNLITPTFDGTANIASGVIAPTATGYFELLIDASDTDLSFHYNITVSNAQDSIVSDVRVTSASFYAGGTGAGVPLTVNNGAVTGVIRLVDQRVNKIRFNIEWNDGAGSTMDNAADTATTTAQESVAKVSVVANFVQASA